MGFGTGPGYAAQHTERFDPPVDFNDGIAWLERYRSIYRRARLEFESGLRLWFSGATFERAESVVARQGAHPARVR